MTGTSLVLILFLLVLLAVGVAAWPWVRELRRKPMDAAARTAAPGRFAQLSQGVTHFRWHGPATGPVAVCVHGLTTPGFVWDAVAEGLVGMGYRVLVYDLYGRGYSDRPTGRQDAAFFHRQLDDLLAHEGVEDRFMLLGYSMGGAIAASYAAAAPKRIKSLALLAPAGMQHDLGRTLTLLKRHPWLSRWLMHASYPRIHRKGCEAERAAHPEARAVVAGQLAEQSYRGWVDAIASSLRGMLSTDTEAAHRVIAGVGLPVLAIWGREDGVIPLSARDRLAEWNPDVSHVVVDGAGHGLPYTHAAEVVAALQRFAGGSA